MTAYGLAVPVSHTLNRGELELLAAGARESFTA